MVNTSFMAQAAPGIRRKLQILDGFAGMNITQLIEIANKVNMNKGVTDEREAKKKIKKKVSLLATTLREKDNMKARRPPNTKRGETQKPLAKDQCAYCKEKGHWKNKCPNWERLKMLPKKSQEENFIGLA